MIRDEVESIGEESKEEHTIQKAREGETNDERGDNEDVLDIREVYKRLNL